MEDAVKYFYLYVKQIFHSLHEKQSGGREEAVVLVWGFFFFVFFKKNALKFFLVCVCSMHSAF